MPGTCFLFPCIALLPFLQLFCMSFPQVKQRLSDKKKGSLLNLLFKILISFQFLQSDF